MTNTKIMIFILSLLALATCQVYAEPIEVPNHSFEYADGELVGDIGQLFSCTPDYWEWGSGEVGANGVEWPESDGYVCAALNAEESIYQLLDHTIAAGDEYTLVFDAFYLWSGSTYDCTFEGRLYYDDNGERVVMDYYGDQHTEAYVWFYDCTLYINVEASSPAVGKQLGIELAAVSQPSNSWFGFDNVRLDGELAGAAVCINPEKDETGVPVTTILEWAAPPTFTPLYYDLYFGDDANDFLAAFLLNHPDVPLPVYFPRHFAYRCIPLN